MDCCFEVRVTLDHASGEPFLEQMAPSPVPAVEALRIDAVEAMHSARHVLTWRLDEQVVMGPQQAPRVAPPTEPVDNGAEQAEKSLAVEIVGEDGHPADTARR